MGLIKYFQFFSPFKQTRKIFKIIVLAFFKLHISINGGTRYILSPLNELKSEYQN